MKTIPGQRGQRNQVGPREAAPQKNDKSSLEDTRRHFLKRAVGGLSLGTFMFASTEDTVAQVTSEVKRASSPSALKITDLRCAVVQHLGRRVPILRIDTNQGIYGLGEVRDGGDERYALMLKSRLLGQNPCNVEKLFKTIKQFGGHGRQGGGVSGVEMALWDLTGKAYGVPCWQLLGGRYREQVRLYTHLPKESDPELFKAKLKELTEVRGFTWLKLQMAGLKVLSDVPGAFMNAKFWEGKIQPRHPFTAVQLTEKGLHALAQYFDGLRNIVGYEIPISTDQFGHRDINDAIRMAKALEPYRLGWLEDIVPWDLMDQWKTVTDAIDTPTITGEDIYLKESFIKLCDLHAVDIVHPDLATAGGMLETKKIGDYAESKGVAMAMHFAGTPISFMASVHCAAATQNFLALEFHPDDIAGWESMVRPTGKQPLITKGFANVPDDAPGLGVELNDEVIKMNLIPENQTFFAPTPDWDDKRSSDGQST